MEAEEEGMEGRHRDGCIGKVSEEGYDGGEKGGMREVVSGSEGWQGEGCKVGVWGVVEGQEECAADEGKKAVEEERAAIGGGC